MVILKKATDAKLFQVVKVAFVHKKAVPFAGKMQLMRGYIYNKSHTCIIDQYVDFIFFVQHGMGTFFN